jgi:hypothetical protein
LQNHPPTVRFVIKPSIFCVRHKARQLAHNTAQEKARRVIWMISHRAVVVLTGREA